MPAGPVPGCAGASRCRGTASLTGRGACDPPLRAPASAFVHTGAGAVELWDHSRWAPRIICLGYAAFISVFALDALGGGKTLAANAAALLLHLLPTLALVLLLAVAWRRATGAGGARHGNFPVNPGEVTGRPMFDGGGRLEPPTLVADGVTESRVGTASTVRAARSRPTWTWLLSGDSTSSSLRWTSAAWTA